MSERICDVSLFSFALWTLSCHLVVTGGGNLYHLLGLFAALTTSMALWRWRRGRTASPRDSVPKEVPPLHKPLVNRFFPLRLSGLFLAFVGTVIFAFYGDVVFLWWWFFILLGAASVFTLFFDEPRIEAPVGGRRQEVLILLLALGAATFSLISHRPNADDSVYINMAVSAADHPRETLLATDTLHGIPGLPIHLPAYRVHSYELLNGALSYLTGIPAIYLFHWLSAAAAAFLVPYALAMLYRLLLPRSWPWAVAMTLLILLSVGGIHRWYGNFALVRIWQGKSIFLFIFLPLIYAYGMRFALRPSRGDALRLAAAQIAAIGCTSSALWAAPLSAGIALLTASRPSWAGLRALAYGLLGSVYVLFLGLMTKEEMADAVSWARKSPPPAEPGSHLQTALTTLLGEDRLLLFGVFTLLATWALYRGGLVRRFAIIPASVVGFSLLNPYFAPLIQGNLTGPSYWRVFWSLPLPFLMALLLVAPLTWEVRHWQPAGRLLTATGALLFVLLVPTAYGWSQENDVRLDWPGLKVPQDDYAAAKALNAAAKMASDGTEENISVVAPNRIGLWVPTFHHHAYPLRVRKYLDTNREFLTPEEFENRRIIRDFVTGATKGTKREAVFREGLRNQSLKAVCLNRRAKTAARAEETGRLLAAEGFQRIQEHPEYEIWARLSKAPAGNEGWSSSSGGTP